MLICVTQSISGTSLSAAGGASRCNMTWCRFCKSSAWTFIIDISFFKSAKWLLICIPKSHWLSLLLDITSDAESLGFKQAVQLQSSVIVWFNLTTKDMLKWGKKMMAVAYSYVTQEENKLGLWVWSNRNIK